MNTKLNNGESWCAPATCAHVCRQLPAVLILFQFLLGIPCPFVQATTFQSREYEYRMPITFTGYTRPETLTNIPLLVELSANTPGFSYSQFASASGGDLRFTDAAGTNDLPYEIDWWNPTSNSYVWVNVPALSNNTIIVAWWGNSNETTAPAYTTNGMVWSNRFVGVWHMSRTTNVQDSSTYAADGTVSGSPTVILDKDANESESIGRSLAFGTNGTDAVVVPDHAALDGHVAMTFSVRYHRQGKGDSWQSHVLAKAADPFGTQFLYRLYHVPTDVKYHYAMDIAGPFSDSADDSSKQVWEHVELIYDGAATNARLYVNGKLEREETGFTGVGNVGTSSEDLFIGNDLTLTNGIAGMLDEVRISNTARSSNWVWATWMNMASGSVFNAYSPVVQTFYGTLFSFR